MTLTLPQSSKFNTHGAYFVDTTEDIIDGINGTNFSFTLPPPLFIPCDNPRNLIRPVVVDVVGLVVYVGILPVLGTCGVITNVINMIVFAKQGLSNRIHVCLFSLAASDAGYVLSAMIGNSHVLISLVDTTAGDFWKQHHIVVSSRPAFLALSNAITALIAFERCLCVLSPLKAAKFFKTKYMGMLIMVMDLDVISLCRYMGMLIMVMAVYILVSKHSGLLLKYQTVQITDPLTNISIYINRLRPYYIRHRTIIDISYVYLVSIAIPCISLILVVICTTAIIIRLRITAQWRRGAVSNMTSVEKQEMSMTRMLVTVCCVYVVCMIPSVTRVFLFTILPGFLSSGYLCNIYRVSVAIAVLLEALNSSINFLIYVKQSSQYRSTLSQYRSTLSQYRSTLSQHRSTVSQLCCRGKQQINKEGIGLERHRHREKHSQKTQKHS